MCGDGKGSSSPVEAPDLAPIGSTHDKIPQISLDVRDFFTPVAHINFQSVPKSPGPPLGMPAFMVARQFAGLYLY
jgi:hypothetical protein